MKIKMLLRIDVRSKKSEVVQASFKTLELPLFDKNYRYEIQEIDLEGDLPKQPNAIYWEVSDFEDIACLMEKGAGKTLFDRSKFEDTLHRMIKNHDALYGIGTLDIEDHLTRFCHLEGLDED